MNNFIKITFAVSLVLLVPGIMLAPPSMPDAPGIPIDGGLSVLIAGGAAYGAKKIRDRKRSQGENEA